MNKKEIITPNVKVIKRVEFEDKNGNKIRAVLKEITQHKEENGEAFPFYDGSYKWYQVQRYVNGAPAGLTGYGPDRNRAELRLKRIAKNGR